LSFLPWLHFNSVTIEGDTSPLASVSLSGTHTSRWRDLEEIGRDDVQNVDGWCSCRVSLGDGYFTALLGLVVVLIAAGGWYFGHDRAAAMAGIMASVGALALAGFNAVAGWNAYIWTNAQQFEFANGSLQPALVLLVIAAVLAALASAFIWGLSWLDDRAYENEMMDDEEPMYEDTSDETTGETGAMA
ncbi:MAG: hypothetical protein ABI559_08600, partial [Chloroflexota bacterium]